MANSEYFRQSIDDLSIGPAVDRRIYSERRKAKMGGVS